MKVVKVVHILRGAIKNGEKPFTGQAAKTNFLENGENFKSKNQKDCGFVTLA